MNDFNISLSKDEARKKLNLSLDKKLVIYTGHLYEWKGAALLLKAARNFQFSISNFQKNEEDILFVFVGGTNKDVQSFRKQTKGLNNILCLGHKPHKDIPIYLKAADVLVLPNGKEEKISELYTSPLKLFEYMAAKRPIIASDLPSIREVLDDQMAVFFKPDNPDQLAESIKKVIWNNHLAETISAKAFERVGNHTWERRVKKILVFADLMN